MKFIEKVKQVQEFGEVMFDDSQESQWENYKRMAQENSSYQRYLSNAGYQPISLPEGVKITPSNRGSSVQPPDKSIEEDFKKLMGKHSSNCTIEGFDVNSFDPTLYMEIKFTDYDHLINERDWYKKRMEEYRDSFWKIVSLIKANKTQLPEVVYNEVMEEYEKY